jgi:hypothetical protein
VSRAARAGVALLALAAAPARAQDAGPLRLLLQGDEALSRPSPLAPDDAPDGLVLRLRRARVGEELSGHEIHARVLFEAQPDSARGTPYAPLAGGLLPIGGPVRVTDAFAGWAPSRAFEVDAGSLRVPFSRARQVDEGDLPMPERPAFVQADTPDFRTGLAASGDLGEILYQAAVFSADRAVDRHLFEAGYLAAGRLVVEPIGPVGLRPWRRGEDDPWSGWFRFAAGASVLYGTLAAPRTLAVDPEFAAQWRRYFVSAEYLVSMRLGSGTSFDQTGAQGAVLEPGLTYLRGRGLLVARGAWQRAGGVTLWGAGAALTAFAPDPRQRLTVGFEQRWSDAPPARSTWVIVRLTIAID